MNIPGNLKKIGDAHENNPTKFLSKIELAHLGHSWKWSKVYYNWDSIEDFKDKQDNIYWGARENKSKLGDFELGVLLILHQHC